jgi:hypothetical protein
MLMGLHAAEIRHSCAWMPLSWTEAIPANYTGKNSGAGRIWVSTFLWTGYETQAFPRQTHFQGQIAAIPTAK